MMRPDQLLLAVLAGSTIGPVFLGCLFYTYVTWKVGRLMRAMGREVEIRSRVTAGLERYTAPEQRVGHRSGRGGRGA